MRQEKRCLPFLGKFIGTGFEALKVRETLVSSYTFAEIDPEIKFLS
ncbi:hypothetical protein [Nostoc sp.]